MLHTWEAAILGFIQGLTEFLPVSSSGHLVLAQRMMGLHDASIMTFDVMLHVGTLVALLAVFWSDLLGLLVRPFQRLTGMLLMAMIPTAVFGFCFKGWVEDVFQSGITLGMGFLATGCILWFAQRAPSRGKEVKSMSLLDAGVIGVMQGIAILPAVSRSGSTIAGALFRGLERTTAARFSFLLAIPTIAGAALVKVHDAAKAHQLRLLVSEPFLVGFVVAAVSGYFAVRYMLRIIARGSLDGFAWYCWGLGAVVIVLRATGNL